RGGIIRQQGDEAHDVVRKEQAEGPPSRGARRCSLYASLSLSLSLSLLSSLSLSLGPSSFSSLLFHRRVRGHYTWCCLCQRQECLQGTVSADSLLFPL